MPLEELHTQIMRGDYHEVERHIIEEGLNPLAVYNRRTAIELCFFVQSQLKLEDDDQVYKDMLDNVLLPAADRYLIGTGRANRGDIMLINDVGAIQILLADAVFDKANEPLYRKIGEDDHKLSEDFRELYNRIDMGNTM